MSANLNAFYLNLLNRAKKEDYTSHEIEKTRKTEVTTDFFVIENSIKVLDHLITNLQKKSFETDTKSLTEDISEELMKKFGRPNTTWKSKTEGRKFKVWMLRFGHHRFNIFTNREFGTEISIKVNHKELHGGEKDKLIIAFLDKLWSIVNENNPR